MKIRNFAIILWVIILTISNSLQAFAQDLPYTEETKISGLIESEQKEFDYHRACDEKTGIILEKYDTLLNGDNTVDYVKLATSLSMDKADRVAAMYFITKIYEDVTASEQAYLWSYINAYAPYTGEEELHNFCNNILSSYSNRNNQTKGSSYSRSNAVDYALKWYDSTNPIFPNLRNMGGDCANFVSQCIRAGGKTMSGNWYIYRLNTEYPAPNNSEELNYSWSVADPSPWISAMAFNNYWSMNSTTYQYSVEEYKEDHSTIYWEEIYKGDVVQILTPYLWWYEGFHTMIIVDYDTSNKDFIYAAHSRNTCDSKILVKICNDDDYSDCELKFFHIS